MKKLDLLPFIGKTFNYLTIIKEEDREYLQNGKSYVRVLCKCKCGKHVNIRLHNLLYKKPTKSCGCFDWVSLRKKYINGKITHKMSRTKQYSAWSAMIERCKNKNNRSYHNYGGRGISVCERWHKFDNFYADMGNRPTPKHSIDRIDNNGNYCPENCRWATQKEQCRNLRKNRMIEYDGKILCVAEWAEIYNIRPDALYYRIFYKNWDIHRALTTKVLSKKEVLVC